MTSILVRHSLFAILFACGAAYAGDRPPQAATSASIASAPDRVQAEFKLVPVKPTFPAASAEAKAAVKLRVEQGQVIANGGMGFSVAITGWMPNGRVTTMLIGSKGQSVYVIPFEQPMQMGADGGATFLVPYTLDGLAPGAWKLVIDGASGEHSLNLQIPVVHAPDAEHKTAWVNVDATADLPTKPAAASNPGAKKRKH